MRSTRHEPRVRRHRLALVLGTVAVCIAGVALVILLVSGTSGLVRLFTVPWLKAESGNTYTPTGALKRFFEKLAEKDKEE